MAEFDTSTGTEARTCPTCLGPFSPRKRHYWQCFECWSKQHAASSPAGPSAESIKIRIAKLEEHISRLQARCKSLEGTALILREAVDHWRTRAYAAEGAGTGTLPAGFAEQLPRIIQLCHPDRNGGSDAAVKATQWLLSVREALRHGQ